MEASQQEATHTADSHARARPRLRSRSLLSVKVSSEGEARIPRRGESVGREGRRRRRRSHDAAPPAPSVAVEAVEAVDAAAEVGALPRKSNPVNGRRKKKRKEKRQQKGVEMMEDLLDLELRRDRYRGHGNQRTPESRVTTAVQPNKPLPEHLVRYQLMRGSQHSDAASIDMTMALLADIRSMAP